MVVYKNAMVSISRNKYYIYIDMKKEKKKENLFLLSIHIYADYYY